MTSPPYRRRTDIPGMRSQDDQMIAMITALTSEMAVLRERVDTLETLLGAQAVLTPGAIDAFVPGDADTARRDGLRRSLIAKVFRPLRDAAARAARQDTTP